MKIATTRFGELEVPENVIIRMTKPVLGFEQLHAYVIIETEDFAPFKWYQSIDQPDVAFVVVNPLLFFPDYVVEVNPKEIEELKVGNVSDIVTYAIVTIPRDFTKMTANLQGPLLINSRTNLAKQLVLVNSQYRIKHRMIEAVVPEEQEERQQPVPIRA
jgi:flagellar assembly factor FliW